MILDFRDGFGGADAPADRGACAEERSDWEECG
jgi:hypothetical protein